MPTRSRRWLATLLLALSVAAFALAAPATQPADPGAKGAAPQWPNWRGPTHDGVSTEKGWLTAWPADGLKQLWKVELGPGHAAPAVQSGKVYIMGRIGKQDAVFCLNADTGAEAWNHAYPAVETPYGRGQRATPAVDGQFVYALSADGQAFCLDAATGQPVWTKDLLKDLNLILPRHKFASAPVVDGNLLLLNLGVSGLALEKKTGKVVWQSPGDSSYSSPVPFNLGSKRCVALTAATQAAVMEEATGQQVAALPRKILDNTHCADPLIVGESIFVTSGYNVGSALIDLRRGNAVVRWKAKFGCVYASPVLVGDYLYALIEAGWEKADLACVSVKDGSVKWTQEKIGAGGLIVADSKLLILSRSGDLILAAASPTAYTELARAKVFTTGACWNSPVLCDGRIYARNDKGTLICLDVRGK